MKKISEIDPGSKFRVYPDSNTIWTRSTETSQYSNDGPGYWINGNRNESIWIPADTELEVIEDAVTWKEVNEMPSIYDMYEQVHAELPEDMSYEERTRIILEKYH